MAKRIAGIPYCCTLLTPPLLLLLLSAALPHGATALEDPAHSILEPSQPAVARCMAFKVENKLCCGHYLLLCDNMCYNGKNLVYPSPPPGASLCSDPDPGTVADNGILRPVKCREPAVAGSSKASRTAEFDYALHLASELESRMGPLEARPAGWLENRTAVTWREGLSYVQVLGGTETNVAHFVGKVNSMLLLNNATGPSLLLPVDRIMLPRQQGFRNVLVQRGDASGNTMSYYSSLVRYLAYAALRGVLPPGAAPEPAAVDTHAEFAFPLAAGPTGQDAAALGNRTLAFGRLEFEAPFEAATEAAPLCWRRAIFPGMMKAIAYIGGPPAARVFKQTLANCVGPLPPVPWAAAPPGGGGPVRLLYLMRTGSITGGRRLLVPESLEMLRGIFKRLQFEVSEAELAGRTFKEQFAIVQGTEVIVSLHSAALTNACMLSREGTSVIEIMPYRFRFDMFRVMAMSAGANYFRHECSVGNENSTWRQAVRSKDEVYGEFSRQACTGSLSCSRYFLQNRAVEFGPSDAAHLEQLLGHAKDTALWMRAGREAAAEKMRARFGGSDGAAPGGMCVAGAEAGGWTECRQSVVSSPFVDPQRPCVVAQEC